MSEIKLRASMRIGELPQELDKAKPGGKGDGAKIPSVGKSKARAMADAA
ncbi:MAG: hypothetical protein JOZ58_17140 [Acetobacteraceae bacterium]|nr:hypothetical protein [Acetobacteraceae bacterium]